MLMLFKVVFTTGATVNECAKALLSAGAVEVKVLTAARA
jgi:predicted amidophosphoribosyltransferase